MPYFWVDDETQIIIDALKNRIAELEEQRDRLKEGLQQILHHQKIIAGDMGEYGAICVIARKALASLDKADSQIAEKQNPTGEGE